MPAYLIVGNPASGKSTLAAELSHHGLIAVDADDFASGKTAPAYEWTSRPSRTMGGGSPIAGS